MPVFLLVALMAAFIWRENTSLQITEHKITSSKIGDSSFNGFTVVQLSDLHGMSFGANNSKLVSAVLSANPDAVVLTGDMVSSEYDDRIFIDLCAELVKHARVYYIRGNHELSLDVKRFYDIKQAIHKLGVVMLDNEKVELIKGVNLYGLYSRNIYKKDPSREKFRGMLSAKDLNRLLGSPTSEEYNILLSHTPAYFEAYNDWGADLTLCGHMHGGMIRIPLVGGLLSPYRRFFPLYDAGFYHKSSGALYVNRGLGNGKVGFRAFNRPEVTVFRFFKIKTKIN